MSRTEHFRNAHNEILRVAGELMKLSNLAELQKDAVKARSALTKLVGKLLIHLQMEDKSLFPSLEQCNDEKLKSTLKKFVTEMGGIRATFDQYTKKWATADSIRSNAAAFIDETKSLFNTLSKRIEKENSELYALIDALK